MRKSQLWKRVLTGALVLALTVTSAAPVMAAEVQPSDSIVAEEDAGIQDDAAETVEDPQEEIQMAEAEVTVPEMSETDNDDAAEMTQEAVQYADSNSAAKAVTVTPSVSNFRIASAKTTSYGDSVRFGLTYAVANCERLYLEIKDANGNYIDSYSFSTSGSNGYWDDDDNYHGYNYNTEYWLSLDYYEITAGRAYTFTLTPSITVWDEEEDDDVTVEGTPAAAIWTAPGAEAVTGLAVKELTPEGIYFSHSVVSEASAVRYQYSTDSTFNEKLENNVHSTSADYLSYDSLTPGITYYVRAYAMTFGTRGAYSNVVTVKAPVAEAYIIRTEIFDKGITLKLGVTGGTCTGFEISRKIGKKYHVLATTTAYTYNETGLEKDTSYTYRVRAYYYNSDTKKIAYGEYEYVTVQTGAAPMNLKAQATGKSSIKLTWKKVSGADGYDVYRETGFSSSSTVKAGEENDFGKYELVKSLGKKKKSFTDKKLVAGEGYSYRVKAYKLVKKQKVYFTEAYASANTKFSFSTSVDVYKEAQNPKNGKVAIAWNTIPQAKGYLIEKYDDVKNIWVTQQKINKAKKTTYTLPASPLGKTVHYRIRAFKGNKYSGSDDVYVTGRIAAVTGVKAKASASGVQVSWKAVAGASYYRVYRTADLGSIYNADTKTYGYDGGESVEIQAFKQASITDNYYYTLGSANVKMQRDYEAAEKLAYKSPYSTSSYVSTYQIPGTSVVDYAYSYHRPVYDDKGIATKEDITSYGPKSDVTYQYYVVAYREYKDTDGSVITARSYGDSKSATAAMSTISVKAPSLKKVKAGKKSATVSYKKVKGAKQYLIYRSDKKKGTYALVGASTKTSFKDTGLTAKKTYYYKVKAVVSNSLGADKYSAFSKVKSAKAK